MGMGTTMALATCSLSPHPTPDGEEPTHLAPHPCWRPPSLWPITSLGFLRSGERGYGVRVGIGVRLRPLLCVGVADQES